MSAHAVGERQERSPTRVLIVDDSFLIREGLRDLLARSPLVEVVATAGDAMQALDLVNTAPPDVVLTDIRMPPGYSDEGLVLAESLRRSHPEVGVVVLSQHASAALAATLLESGSSGRGYLLKDRIDDLGQLVDSLVTVAGGGCRIDSVLVDQLIAADTRAGSPLTVLTPRQLDILREVATGKSNLAIAREQNLTLRAVEKHISDVFIRLGISQDPLVSRRVSATLLYLDHGSR